MKIILAPTLFKEEISCNKCSIILLQREDSVTIIWKGRLQVKNSYRDEAPPENATSTCSFFLITALCDTVVWKVFSQLERNLSLCSVSKRNKISHSTHFSIISLLLPLILGPVIFKSLASGAAGAGARSPSSLVLQPMLLMIEYWSVDC